MTLFGAADKMPRARDTTFEVIMRLTILGGGGFRVPLVHRALLADMTAGDPVVDELVLADHDATRLAAVMAVLERHRTDAGSPALTVRSTTDIEDALSGADLVFSAIRVGGLPGRVVDERVARAEGVLGQETVGAGGISYGLRTAPVADRIAATIAEVAPEAWVVNFTNPAGLVTQVMSRRLGDRVIGICDSPVGLCRRAAHALGVDPAAARFDYAGLNHLGWLRGIYVDGHDRLPELLASAEALTSFEEGELFGAPWLQALGSIPNEYLHYYYFAREALAASVGATRGEVIVGQQQEFYANAEDRPSRAADLWETARLAREETYMAENRQAVAAGERAAEDLAGGGYEAVALAVMRAIVRDDPASLIVNVPNRGALPGLPNDAVIEVPCVVDAQGARPLPAAPLTGHQAALVEAVKSVENEVEVAARTGSRAAALRALAYHPLVDSVAVAQRLLDGYLAEAPGLADVLTNP
jgi:6-phospho-beta-glucosidase